MAKFTMHDEYMNALREAIVSERFFDLPKEISPESRSFHQPDLRLEVTLGGRKQKVLLYDPNELKDDPNAQRFLKVWTRLFEGLPLKPSW